MKVLSHLSSGALWLAFAVSALLAGCASVGPDFRAPESSALSTWAERPSSASELSHALSMSDATLPPAWWNVFNDATLDALQTRAVAANPDLQTAALRFAQSRVQQRMAASQAAPQVDVNAKATRQRQSEHAAETRLVNAVGGANAPQLVQLLSDPFSLYQAGFDVSWELDLWGRVRRSIEAAEASADTAGALLQDVHLTLSSELARAYFQLRQVQHQQALLARDVVIAQEMLALQKAQATNGLSDEGPLLTQTQNLAQFQAQQNVMQTQQAALLNQISLLTGDEPGALNMLLKTAAIDLDGGAPPVLPALALGQPVDWLRRRPDVRAAEARLHAATAQVGVAMADLYPRIALGASAGFQSVASSAFGDWGSRNWQIGPVLSLPIFDRRRRQANVELHRQDQQIAAIAWHQSVLKAWQELDDALTAHASERQRNQRLRERTAASRDQFVFAHARADNGLASALAPLQAELAWRQTLIDLTDSDARLRTSLVSINKTVGGDTNTASVRPP
jgi:NodT family efflux transporter outer membrane factor (OMF) lipoprotein